jgi:hypothetical protein
LAFVECRKEVSEWTGLSYILLAIVGIGGFAGISKAIQKKYENSNNSEAERQSSNFRNGDGDGC